MNGRELKLLVKKWWFRKAAVLVYHRVATVQQDIWSLAVSEEAFKEQLQVLKKKAHVVSVPELVNGLKEGRLKKNCVAITFDDGYVDNYLHARPALERHGMPATFFIASQNIGTANEFWWDELEHLILDAPILPPVFSLRMGNEIMEHLLEEETVLTPALQQKHQRWEAAAQEPPTRRGALFLDIWKRVRSLLPAEQQAILQQIKNVTGQQPAPRPLYQSMSCTQLQEMSRHPLFTIGAHTHSHMAMACHSENVQLKELQENKAFLEQQTGQSIDVLAYPYGLYNVESIQAAQEARISAAFTTDEKLVFARSHPYQMGRFYVKNWDGATFQQHLAQWFKQDI